MGRGFFVTCVGPMVPEAAMNARLRALKLQWRFRGRCLKRPGESFSRTRIGDTRWAEINAVAGVGTLPALDAAERGQLLP